mgnify:CR=1 FL=1
MKLSILVPTLESRQAYLDMMLGSLEGQLTTDVEVLIERDNGEKTIGEKRNILLERATGDYVVFVDDDDIVSWDYIASILGATKTDPDVVGIHLLHYENYMLKGLTYHSLRFKEWFEEPHKEHQGLTNYYRNPNHINPVKRELALQVKFPETNMGEDKEYSKNLLPLLNTEHYVATPIYCYLFRSFK